MRVANGFFLIFSFFSLAGHGQSILSKGYVVLKGDTLRGYVEEKKNYYKSSDLKFRLDGEKIVSYPLKDISTINLSDHAEMYIQREVDIDKKPIESGELESDISKKIVKDSIFLGYLVKGSVDLFFYTDENSKKHFFYRKNENIRELVLVKFMKNQSQLAVFEEFRQDLKNLVADCQKMAHRNPLFTKQSLINFFEDYNTCISDIVYKKEKKTGKLGFGVLGGISFNTLNYIGEDNYNGSDPSDYAGSYPFNSAVVPCFGLFTEFIPRRISKRRVGFEFLWRNSAKYTATNDVTDVLTARQDFYIDLSYINSSLTLKYFFFKKSKVNPFVKIGLGPSFLVSFNSKLVRTIYQTSKEHSPLVNLNSVGYNLFGSIGCSLGKLYVEGRYDHCAFGSTDIRASIFLETPTIVLGYNILK